MGTSRRRQEMVHVHAQVAPRDHGFTQSQFDLCAFRKTKGDSSLTVIFYIDDILIFLWGDEGGD